MPVQTPCRYFATLLQTVFRPRVYLPLTQLGSCFVTRRDGGERDKEKKLAAVSFPNAKGLSGSPLISRFRRRRSCPSHPLVRYPLSLCRLRLRLSLPFTSRLIFPGFSLFYLFILFHFATNVLRILFAIRVDNGGFEPFLATPPQKPSVGHKPNANPDRDAKACRRRYV